MMRKILKKLLCSSLIILLLLPGFTIKAEYKQEIDYANFILVNLDTGQILLQRYADEHVAVASLTKIMTVIVALERNPDLQQKVKFTAAMFTGLKAADASIAGFKVGEEATIEDLLYGAMLPSGADATRALAFHIAGSEEAFALMMNEKASELGMKDSNYANSSGLDNPQQYSCAYDQYLLLAYAIKNPTFLKILKTSEYTTADGKHKFSDSFRQAMIKNNQDASFILGAKTGYESAAGVCLASVVDEKGDRLLFIGLGNRLNRQEARKFQNELDIYSYYIKNYDLMTLYSATDELYTFKPEYTVKKSVTISFGKDFRYYLPHDFQRDDMELIITDQKVVSYKTEKGELIARYMIYYQGEIIDRGNIYLPEALATNFILLFLQYSTKNPLFVIASLLISILVLSSILLRRLRGPRYYEDEDDDELSEQESELTEPTAEIV